MSPSLEHRAPGWGAQGSPECVKGDIASHLGVQWPNRHLLGCDSDKLLESPQSGARVPMWSWMLVDTGGGSRRAQSDMGRGAGGEPGRLGEPNKGGVPRCPRESPCHLALNVTAPGGRRECRAVGTWRTTGPSHLGLHPGSAPYLVSPEEVPEPCCLRFLICKHRADGRVRFVSKARECYRRRVCEADNLKGVQSLETRVRGPLAGRVADASTGPLEPQPCVPGGRHAVLSDFTWTNTNSRRHCDKFREGSCRA